MKARKIESENARLFIGVRINFSRWGQRRHFVYQFQIAEDQCSL